jgi:hypothetical protein
MPFTIRHQACRWIEPVHILDQRHSGLSCASSRTFADQHRQHRPRLPGDSARSPHRPTGCPPAPPAPAFSFYRFTARQLIAESASGGSSAPPGGQRRKAITGHSALSSSTDLPRGARRGRYRRGERRGNVVSRDLPMPASPVTSTVQCSRRAASTARPGS